MKNCRIYKLIIIACVLALGIVSHAAFAETASGLASEKNFTYYTDGRGNATITGFKTQMSGEVVIPETIDGNKVVAIDGYAFEGNATVTEFIFPEGFKQLGLCSLRNCTALKKINIPASLTAMTESALTGCSSLESIVVDPDNQFFDSRDNCNAIIDTDTNVLIIGCQNSTIPDTVTEIGENAFLNQSNLKNIEIPDSVTKIGAYAFAWCEQLESISIPGSVEIIENNAFKYCKSMSKLVIEEGVKRIDNAAFGGCIKLEKLSLPKSVTSVSGNAFKDTRLKEVYLTSVVTGFSDNTYLEKVHFAEGSKTIPNSAFSGCTGLTAIQLPSTIETIGYDAFKGCSNLEEINIPDSVKSIGKAAFMHCTSLKNITVPEGIERIEQYTFAVCSELESVELPAGLKEIDSYAFRQASSLKEINFPDTLETIGDSVFEECVSLKEADLPSSVKSVGTDIFYNCESLEFAKLSENMTSVPAWMFYKCRNLKEVEIPSKVKAIGRYAFRYCESLHSIELPETLEHIDEGAFGGCSNLRSINLPATLRTIGSDAFAGCALIEEVAIPYGVTCIGYCAFMDCSSLKSVQLPYSLTTIESEVFEGCDLLTEITMPESVVELGNGLFPNPFSNLKTIYGVAGSYAETFAAENGVAFIPVEMTHEHCWQTVIKRATIEENGFKRVICNICGEKTEEIYYSPVVTMSDVSSIYYTGEVFAPAVTVEDVNGNSLVKGIDYEITGADKGLNAGVYSFKITFKGKYAGTSEKTFVIKPVTAEMCKVKLPYARTTYNGKEKNPKVTVESYAGKPLAEGTDYNLVYEEGRIKVGRYKVNVTFTGNYDGVIAAYFTVVPAAPKTATANLNSALKLKGYDDIKFSWKKVEGASGYDVYFKKASAGKYTFMTSTTGTSVTKKDLGDGVKYTFKVVPFYKTGGVKYKSLNAKTASVYTLKKLPIPAVTKSGTKVKVKWNNLNGETGYQISRAKTKTGTNIVATYKTTSGTYKNVSAVKGKKFYYKVRAYKVVDGKKVFGPWSVAKAFTRK